MAALQPQQPALTDLNTRWPHGAQSTEWDAFQADGSLQWEEGEAVASAAQGQASLQRPTSPAAPTAALGHSVGAASSPEPSCQAGAQGGDAWTMAAAPPGNTLALGVGDEVPEGLGAAREVEGSGAALGTGYK